MTVTQVDLDDEALADAMRLSGSRSEQETVNLALREYAAHHRRIAALSLLPNAQTTDIHLPEASRNKTDLSR